MSELNLSLYHLAEGGDLLELFEMRAEAKAHVDDEFHGDMGDNEKYLDALQDLQVLDEQIAAYMAALPAKVDSVRHVWKRIEVLIAEAAAEAKFQQARDQHLKADLERLKDYCQRCMELIEWKPGKPRKLEGRSGYLLLKGNGGRPAVEVYDESLLPDELCTVTVTLLASEWHRGTNLRTINVGPRTPNLSLISARLSEVCLAPGCRDGIWHHPELAEDAPCPECGGSGKQSVPGGRLKEPGTHVECK